MRPLLLLVMSGMVFASCGNEAGSYTGRMSVTSPDAASTPLAVRLSPEKPTVTGFADVSCRLVPGFETAFDVIVTGGSGLNLDRVTLQMLDGTHLGSALTFPTPVLSTMFGSTVIVGSRSFRFKPRFGCLGITPQVLVVDLLFRDRFGTTLPFTLNTKF